MKSFSSAAILRGRFPALLAGLLLIWLASPSPTSAEQLYRGGVTRGGGATVSRGGGASVSRGGGTTISRGGGASFSRGQFGSYSGAPSFSGGQHSYFGGRSYYGGGYGHTYGYSHGGHPWHYGGRGGYYGGRGGYYGGFYGDYGGYFPYTYSVPIYGDYGVNLDDTPAYTGDYYAPSAPLYAPDRPDTGDDLIAQVQRSLKSEGYYHGPVDNIPGPATRSAISAFQEDNGLPVTGRVDRRLLENLDF